MSLLNRLSGVEEPKLPVHQFWAAMIEYVEGEVTRQNVIDAFQISVTEEADLDWLKGKIDASTDKPSFMHHIHSLFMLAEKGIFGYDTQATIVARINGLP